MHVFACRKRLPGLCLALLLGGALGFGPGTQNLAADPPPARQYAPSREVDYLHVTLDLTPDFRARTLGATATLRFRPIARPLRELGLDAVDLRITQVTATEPVQAWQNTDRRLVITFAAELPPEREVSVTVTYTAEPRAGLYFRTPEMGYPAGDTHLFTQGEAILHRHWFPCFDAPNEKLTSEVICRVPAGMTVLSNGRLLSETPDADGRTVFHWLQDKPHVNYLIAVVAGHFRQLEDAHGDLRLTFHTPPSEFAWAETSFRGTRDMMAFFEREIGVPYPWDRYAQVCVHDFVAGGMENTTLTVLTHHTLFPPETENTRSSQGLVAHELVHQWFGDFVTCKDWSHLWLNEGFATYYDALYEHHVRGRDAFRYQLRHYAQEVLNQSDDTTPIVWRGFGHPDEQFSFRAYPKGAWVLHMLRSQLGEALYRRVVQTWLERHAYGTVVTESFNAVLEELSGLSFDRFFDQWVYHAGHPQLDIAYTWDETTKLARLNIRQTQKLSDRVLLFHLPLPVRFRTPAGVTERTLNVSAAEENFHVALPAAPTLVRIDPDYTVLAKVNFTPPNALLDAQLADPGDLIGRLLAIEILATRKDLESVTKLRTVLNSDAFHGARIEASKALRTLHTDAALEALLASTGQADATVRRQVREDLRAFYRDTVLTSTREALRTERNPDVLRELILTLGTYTDPAIPATLLTYLRSDSFRNILAEAAIEAMRAQDDPSFITPLLETLQTREAAFTSDGFATGLGVLAHLARHAEDREAVRTFLARQTYHPKSRVKRAALAALGTLGDPKALAVVETFTRAGQESPERKAAQDAVAKLRAARRPADEFRALRDEVLGFRKEARELRAEIESLRNQVKELAAPSP